MMLLPPPPRTELEEVSEVGERMMMVEGQQTVEMVTLLECCKGFQAFPAARPLVLEQRAANKNQ